MRGGFVPVTNVRGITLDTVAWDVYAAVKSFRIPSKRAPR